MLSIVLSIVIYRPQETRSFAKKRMKLKTLSDGAFWIFNEPDDKVTQLPVFLKAWASPKHTKRSAKLQIFVAELHSFVAREACKLESRT